MFTVPSCLSRITVSCSCLPRLVWMVCVHWLVVAIALPVHLGDHVARPQSRHRRRAVVVHAPHQQALTRHARQNSSPAAAPACPDPAPYKTGSKSATRKCRRRRRCCPFPAALGRIAVRIRHRNMLRPRIRLNRRPIRQLHRQRLLLPVAAHQQAHRAPRRRVVQHPRQLRLARQSVWPFMLQDHVVNPASPPCTPARRDPPSSPPRRAPLSASVAPRGRYPRRASPPPDSPVGTGSASPGPRPGIVTCCSPDAMSDPSAPSSPCCPWTTCGRERQHAATAATGTNLSIGLEKCSYSAPRILPDGLTNRRNAQVNRRLPLSMVRKRQPGCLY